MLISLESTDLSAIVVSTLHKLGVEDNDITLILFQEGRNTFNIQEKLMQLLKNIYYKKHRMFILNMLPVSTQILPLEASSSEKAEWLGFESTLEILKLLSKLDMNDNNVIAIIKSGEEGRINPWGGVSRAMAASADLETRQHVISADLQCDVDENAFRKLILACTNKTIEDRIIITKDQLLQPVLERYNFRVR